MRKLLIKVVAPVMLAVVGLSIYGFVALASHVIDLTTLGASGA